MAGQSGKRGGKSCHTCLAAIIQPAYLHGVWIRRFAEVLVKSSMRIAILAAFILVIPTLAWAGGGSLGSATSGDSLYAPQYGIIGNAIGNRVTTMTPRGDLTPAGPLSSDPARSEREENKLLLEQHLDCFSGPVPPDRDVRNSFRSRCPGNTR